MDDLELDDLDSPPQAPPPSRPSKFAPKNSKLNPKPKPEPDSKPEAGAPVSNEGDLVGNAKPPVNMTTPKAEPASLNDDVSVMKMDVDAKAADAVEHEPTTDKTNDVPMAEAAEEEDVVVREIDVFFNPSLNDSTQLYVLQYPLRPTWRPYDMDEKCKEVRVKPKSTEVEVDLSMDTDSKNYDPDGQFKLTKQTLLTRWTPIHTSGYAVGVLNDDKLFLNPVRAVVQLRPSMNHINPKTKNNATIDTKEPKGGSVGPSKKQAPSKPVESSTGGKTEDEDCWVQLKYHGLDSDLSAGYLKSMVEQKTSPIQFTMNPYDYINSLCPGVSSNNKPKGPSKRYLLSLPLEERIKKLLCEGSAFHRFNALKHFAPDHSVEELLGILQQHAVLIQGLWTAKTGLLHLQDASKSLARDYALTLFNKNLVVKEANVHKPFGSFVNNFGVARDSFKDIKFKEPPDVSFMKLYPDIVKKQQVILDGIEAGINKHISKIRMRVPGGRNRPVEKKAPAMPAVAGKPGSLTGSDKGTNRVASETPKGKTISAETLEALPKALQKLFQNHKVCSYTQICNGLRDMAVYMSALPKADAKMAVDAAYAADAPKAEFQEVASQFAVDIHGSFVLRKSPEHPEHDPLRKVVIDLFLGKEANASLKRADVVEAAKIVLKRDITNNEYSKKLVKDVVAAIKSAVTNPIHQPFTERVLSMSIYDCFLPVMVMNDLCESKGSAWFLRSGN